MIQYQFFHRNFVVRKPDQITRPPLPRLERFELPVMAMVHYMSPSATNPWPTEDLLFYQRNVKPLRVTHHSQLADFRGNPKINSGDVNSLIREFRGKNPRFRAAVDIESMKREPRVIVTHNYGLLAVRYRYIRGMFTFQNRWHNIFSTMFKSIGENTNTGYHQYLELQLPQKLPARSTLDKSVDGWNTRNMGIFNSYEMLLLHHLWVWLGERREIGLIHKYIPNINNVKIILRESGRFTVIDLALLNEWRKPSVMEKQLWKKEKEINPALPVLKGGLWNPSELQRMFLRMLMSVMEVRAADVPEQLGDETAIVTDADKAVTNDTTDVVEETVNEDTGEVTNHVVPVSTTARSITTDNEITEAEAFGNYDDELERLNLISEIDKDLEVLEQTSREEDNLPIPESIDDTEEVTNGPEEVDTQLQAPAAKVATFFPVDNGAGFRAMADRAAESNSVTAAEYRRLLEASERFETIPAPLGHPGTMQDFVVVKKEEVEITESPSIPDQPTIFDKSMLKSSLLGNSKRYARHVMQKDIASMVGQLRSAGVVINNYSVVEKEDITGAHYEYNINVKPIEGNTSTLSMKIPKVNDEGNFIINSVPYVLRRQRGDLPIRKIGPDQVALTSYYGKVFVDRSEKRVNDWGKWLRNAIMAKGLSAADPVVTKLVPGNSFASERHAPKIFSSIAMGFRTFTLLVDGKNFDCNFDMANLVTTRGVPSMAIAGICHETNERLMFGFDDHIYIQGDTGIRQAPSIEEILGLDAKRSPVEFAELKVFGKHIPVGVVLGYLLGLEPLIALINAPSMRTVPVGKRLNLVGDEWAINFDNKSYVFSRRDRLATIVFGGWRDFTQTTSRFPTDEFNKKDVYFNLFEEKKLGVRYLRELDLLEQMFVDPITRELLVLMKEPVVFTKLLLRSSEMLCNDQHPNSQDTAFMRIKGYERFAGAVYSELVRAVRIHNGRPGKHNHGLELNPYAVWIGIQQDPAKDQVSEINPIQNLKEAEAVTYSGTGGRSSRSMVTGTRIFHENDMGVISESTVDSSDVAINMFTSADPQFDSLRGTSRPYDYATQGPTPLLSTTALSSPGSTRDDPKRVNFAGIQNRHVVACGSYRQAILRTGYEQVIPHRVGDLFAVTAKQPGKVISINKDGIIVEYADGERQGVQLGRRYGNAAGLTIPHTIVSELTVGESFDIGTPIAYNTGFFERDVLNHKQIIWKTATLARVALLESPDTLEDSSAISKELSERLMTEQTKIKDIVVNFDQVIHRMVKEGDKVEPESILCIIEEAMSAQNSYLNEDTIDSLRVLGAPAPQAKIKGQIERIEVYYNGELEDMSPSLRSIVMSSDKRIVSRNASVGKKPYTGLAPDEFRIGTEPLLMDTACIRIYMGAMVAMGSGDKGVFANQLKTVIGRVYNNNIRTESGVVIDALFGATSLAARIVRSPYLIGTTTSLLIEGGKRVVRAYRS